MASAASVAATSAGGWPTTSGAVRSQQMSLVTGGVSFLVLGAIRQPLFLAVALFTVATLIEAFRPAVMTAFAERAPAELQAKAFAFLRLSVNLGMGIGAALGGALALYGYRWLFIADAATCFGAFLLCAGFALMPYHDARWYLAFTVLVWTSGEMLALPILNAVVAERAGAGVQGRYMGLYMMAFSVAFIVAPIAGTYVYDVFGPITLWQAMAVVGVGLWVGSVVLKPYLRG